MQIPTSSRKPRWFSIAILLALVVLIHSGCATLPDHEKPRITLNNIVLKETESIAPILILNLNIENPNDFSFDITGLDMTLRLNDHVLAHGLSNQQVTIPRYSSGQLNVEASMDLLNFLQQFFALVTQQEFTYEVSGHVKVAKGLFPNQKIEFSETGDIDADDLFDSGKKPKSKSGNNPNRTGVF